ncbi:MAG: SGNH/GDSL hydrolase family protein [Mucilaginibacter sp.]
MKLLYSIILTVTTLSGCTKKNVDIAYATNTPTKPDTIVKVDSLSYIALGDSYTIGQSVPLTDSYPYQVTGLLKNDGLPVSVPKIIAITGWTTDNLIAAINQRGLIGKKYDFVTLLIGVNDQYQGLSQANYKTKFAQVLNTAITFAKGDTSRVFVLSIPDYGVTPFANGNDAVIGPLIDQFNAINKKISLAAGVHYLDITGISRNAAMDASLVAPDGLHPSSKMYTEWVNLLEPMVKARLKMK